MQINADANADADRTIAPGSQLAIPKDFNGHLLDAACSGLAAWPHELAPVALPRMPAHSQPGPLRNGRMPRAIGDRVPVRYQTHRGHTRPHRLNARQSHCRDD